MTQSEESLYFGEAEGIVRRFINQEYKQDGSDLCKEYVTTFNEHKLKLMEKLIDGVSCECEYYVILTGKVFEEYLCTKSLNDVVNRVFYILSEYKYGIKEGREKKYVSFNLIPSEKYIQDAIVFATRKHEGQLRKGTHIPYIVHPMHVMYILQKMEFPTSVVVAGVLHDTLEDTDATEEEIKEIFGSKVLEYIKGMSEDKTKSWKERKNATIVGLATDCEAVRAINFADKYSNLLSMYEDLQHYHESLWSRFNASKEEIEWYYRGVGDALYSSFHDFDEYEEYIKLLDVVFGDKIG